MISFTSLASFTVELADTEETRRTGWMGRKNVEEDTLILFIFPEPQIVSLWMYNVFLDLEAAFLDDQGKIVDIELLKAYPHLMEAKDQKEVQHFFLQKAVSSKTKVKYVIETQRGFFEKHGFTKGSVLNLNALAGKPIIESLKIHNE